MKLNRIDGSMPTFITYHIMLPDQHGQIDVYDDGSFVNICYWNSRTDKDKKVYFDVQLDTDAVNSIGEIFDKLRRV